MLRIVWLQVSYFTCCVVCSAVLRIVCGCKFRTLHVVWSVVLCSGFSGCKFHSLQVVWCVVLCSGLSVAASFAEQKMHVCVFLMLNHLSWTLSLSKSAGHPTLSAWLGVKDQVTYLLQHYLIFQIISQMLIIVQTGLQMCVCVCVCVCVCMCVCVCVYVCVCVCEWERERECLIFLDWLLAFVFM